MATYEITDSVLKRHHEQHIGAGGAPVASSFDRAANTATTAANAASSDVAASASTAASESKAGGGLLKWLVPLALLGALAWAAFTFL